MERGIIKILGSDATSFAACFYNEKKVTQGKAEQPIMMNLGDLQKFNVHSPVVLSRYFQKIADQNPNVVHPQLHLMGTLPGNPPQEEKQLFIEQLKKVLDKLGYGGQPTLIYPHIDTNNWHVHCVSVRINQETGHWINNWNEGKRARFELDKLRGVTTPDEIEKFLDYKFESKEQFLSLLRANGFPKSYYDEDLDYINVIRAGDVRHIFTLEEVQQRINKVEKNKDREKNRIKELRGILRDRRHRSMNYLVDNPDVKITKDGKHHTVSERLRDIRGAAFEGHEGLDIKGIRKAQFKQFLEELKSQMGIAIIFNQWKDGSTKGYTLIDHKSKTVFKGSDVLALDELLNPNWRKGQEKDQVLTANEAYESTQQLIDSPSLADDIYNQLTNLGLDIHDNNKDEVRDISTIFPTDIQKNREEAIRIFRDIIRRHPEPWNENEDGYIDFSLQAQKAFNHADVAEWLEYLKEQEKNNKKEEPELDRNSLAWDEVGDYILNYFNQNDIEYNFKQEFFLKDKSLDEKRARELAFAKFDEAIKATENNQENAADIAWEALAYVQIMEKLHQNPELIKQLEKQRVEKKKQIQYQTGNKEREETIIDAKRNLYRWHGEMLLKDEKETIINGAAAHAIEKGYTPFSWDNLSESIQELAQTQNTNINKYQISTIMNIIPDALLGIIMSPDVQLSSGGGGGSDLQKQKDDWWNHWKNTFGMHLKTKNGLKR